MKAGGHGYLHIALERSLTASCAGQKSSRHHFGHCLKQGAGRLPDESRTFEQEAGSDSKPRNETAALALARVDAALNAVFFSLHDMAAMHELADRRASIA